MFTSDEATIADYNVTSGYTLNDSNGIQYGKVGVYNIVSKEKTTGDDFLIRAVVKKSYNWDDLYFNYVDSNNFSAVYFANPLKVVNVVNGKETTVYSMEDSTTRNGVERTVKLSRANGVLRLVENNKVIFENIKDENPIDGKFGVRFRHCPSYVKSIKVSDLLHITDVNVSEDDVHKISDDIFAMFDYPLEADTVNTDNIYLSTESGIRYHRMTIIRL